jgi:hypothetical protein
MEIVRVAVLELKPADVADGPAHLRAGQSPAELGGEPTPLSPHHAEAPILAVSSNDNLHGSEGAFSEHHHDAGDGLRESFACLPMKGGFAHRERPLR